MAIFWSLRDSFCALLDRFKRDYKNLILYHNNNFNDTNKHYQMNLTPPNIHKLQV
jgi:hypothetical protein